MPMIWLDNPVVQSILMSEEKYKRIQKFGFPLSLQPSDKLMNSIAGWSAGLSDIAMLESLITILICRISKLSPTNGSPCQRISIIIFFTWLVYKSNFSTSVSLQRLLILLVCFIFKIKFYSYVSFFVIWYSCKYKKASKAFMWLLLQSVMGIVFCDGFSCE